MISFIGLLFSAWLHNGLRAKIDADYMIQHIRPKNIVHVYDIGMVSLYYMGMVRLYHMAGQAVKSGPDSVGVKNILNSFRSAWIDKSRPLAGKNRWIWQSSESSECSTSS